MRHRIASGLTIILLVTVAWVTSAKHVKGAGSTARSEQVQPPVLSGSVPVQSSSPVVVKQPAPVKIAKLPAAGPKAVETTKPKAKVMAAKPAAKPDRKQPASRSKTGRIDVDQVLKVAFSLKGVPYRHGGTSQKGFDCSGFTSYVFEKAAGVDLPRSSSGQAKIGTAVSQKELAPGDIVYFHTYSKGVSHVGIYTGGGNFIHASRSKGITVTNLSDSYYGPRYLGARRII